MNEYRIVDALRGTQIGAIVACALGVETDAPRFTSKAVVTSDGFVQANFVDRDEVMHHSAFVGSFDDLRRNLDSVQDYLARIGEHSDEDRQQLAKAVLVDWIATDYRSN